MLLQDELLSAATMTGQKRQAWGKRDIMSGVAACRRAGRARGRLGGGIGTVGKVALDGWSLLCADRGRGGGGADHLLLRIRLPGSRLVEYKQMRLLELSNLFFFFVGEPTFRGSCGRGVLLLRSALEL